MISLNFKPDYNAVHFTPELGKYMIGGIASFMDNLYQNHSGNIGFVHFFDDGAHQDIRIDAYPGTKDILIVPYYEAKRAGDLSFDTAVVHYYGLNFMADEALLRGRTLVYVVHSVPTAEPYYPDRPFGNRPDIKHNFETLGNRANLIICVSHAEKAKLSSLYPEWSDKIRVIHNGITFGQNNIVESPIRPERKIFGFIGRLDYRKGLLECVKAFKSLDVELRIASDLQDPFNFNAIQNYIHGARMEDRIQFYGWCHGPRKESFLRSLDALVVPSLYEPFGYVVLEAMVSKVPLLCSNRGGIPEIIGAYKYSYDPYDPEGLKDCIIKFQNDSVEEVKREVAALYSRADLFTAEKMRKQYEEILIRPESITKSVKRRVMGK